MNLQASVKAALDMACKGLTAREAQIQMSALKPK